MSSEENLISENENSEKKEEKRKKRNWPLIILLLLIGISLGVVCGLKLAIELLSRSRGQNFYSSLTSDAGSGDRGAAVRERIAAMNDAAYGIIPAALNEDEEYEHRRLRNASLETVAWLKCEGTIIDYPVMQCGNNEYFLTHLPDGRENKMGSIYLDYRNSPDFTDKHSIIYGHHMKSGDMFTTLKYYNDQDFYEKHPTMLLYTAERDYDVVLFAGYVVDATTEVLPLYFRDAAEFSDYTDGIIVRSVFKSGVEVSDDDRIVSLVTCSYEFDNARMLIAGILKER